MNLISCELRLRSPALVQCLGILYSYVWRISILASVQVSPLNDGDARSDEWGFHGVA